MKQTKFFLSGTDVSVVEFDPATSMDKLPAKIYTVRFDNMRGFYLSVHKDKFDVPSRVYGSSRTKAYKVYSTFEMRSKSTGVLLTGDKGAGKTMLSSLVCNMALRNGVPVLLVNEPFSGTEFNQFIDSIGECVVFYDEFAKMFENKDDQNALLTLLDGTSSNKRLFLMTENNENMINEFILDRPGRVFYHFRFDKLEKAIIEEYCTAHGVPEIVEKIIGLHNRMLEFSFDVLSSIVEEYKRYPEDDFDDLTSDINFSTYGGNSPNRLFVEKVIDADSGEEFIIQSQNRRFDDPIDSGSGFFISVKKKDDGDSSDGNGLYLDVDDISEMSDTYIIFTVNECAVICRKLPPANFNKQGLLL